MSSGTNDPRGYFKFLLAIDVETTGLCFTGDTPVYNPNTGERHQITSCGLVVADAATFRPIEELYLEIKWNEHSCTQREQNSNFGRPAEKVHGLTKQYLDEHGIPEDEAVLLIGNILLKYWGNTSIRLLGHNVQSFDRLFFQDMFRRHGVELSFGNRHLDSYSLGFGTVGAFNSDDLFNVFFEQRGHHNALDDAKMALACFRNIRKIWQQTTGIQAYNKH